MNKRIFVKLQIGFISFFMFADQNLMAPKLTLIAEDFGMIYVKDHYLGGLILLTYSLLGDLYSDKKRMKVATLIDLASRMGIAIGQLTKI